jgi:LAO/AO transport system kinase
VKDLQVALHLREGEALRDVPAHHGVDLRRMALSTTRVDAPTRAKEAPEKVAEGPAWRIPVLKTVAQSGEGIPALLDAIDRHREFLEASGTLLARREARAARRVRDVVNRELRKLAWNHPGVGKILDSGVQEIVGGRETPYSLAARLIAELMGSGGTP